MPEQKAKPTMPNYAIASHARRRMPLDAANAGEATLVKQLAASEKRELTWRLEALEQRDRAMRAADAVAVSGVILRWGLRQLRRGGPLDPKLRAYLSALREALKPVSKGDAEETELEAKEADALERDADAPSTGSAV